MPYVRMFWVDVDKDKELVEHYAVYKVPFVLLLHSYKEEIESIRNPRISTITAVIN